MWVMKKFDYILVFDFTQVNDPLLKIFKLNICWLLNENQRLAIRKFKSVISNLTFEYFRSGNLPNIIKTRSTQQPIQPFPKLERSVW